LARMANPARAWAQALFALLFVGYGVMVAALSAFLGSNEARHLEQNRMCSRPVAATLAHWRGISDGSRGTSQQFGESQGKHQTASIPST